MDLKSSELALENRDGLPDSLRYLAQSFPSAEWQGHPNFGQLVQFWLSRHAMFRQVTETLLTGAQKVLWSGADIEAFHPRLARMGGFFLQELHTHHTVEDDHYFPQLIGLEPKLDRGFAVLDADHHALDALLDDFAKTANAALQSDAASHRDTLGAFHTHLTRLSRSLERHLQDEEELIVPIILKTGFAG